MKPSSGVGRFMALIPTVKTSTWRCHDDRAIEADESYRKMRPRALLRDNFTCRGCGFTVRPRHVSGIDESSHEYSGYLDVHHVDDDHHNNELSNLASLCPFCHQVFHVGNGGYRQKASIIYCPWLSQAEVNLLCNLSAVEMHRGGELARVGEAVFSNLIRCGLLADQRYGEGMSSAVTIGMLLMAVYKRNVRAFNDRGAMLAGLRVLPEMDAFQRAVQCWSDSAWLPEVNFIPVYEAWKVQTRMTD